MKKIGLFFVIVGFGVGGVLAHLQYLQTQTREGVDTPFVRGVTINHHLLAPDLIRLGLSKIATDEPRVVVLISPNHFDQGHYPFITSQRDWQISGAYEIISRIAATKKMYVDETPFVREHGVYNVMPFIATALPHARVVPIIVKDTATDTEIDALADELFAQLPLNAVVVGSFDFSHHHTARVAAAHDVVSIAALHNFDFEMIKKTDTDSRPGLRLMLKLLSRYGARSMTLLANTNAGERMRDLVTPEATSYVIAEFE